MKKIKIAFCSVLSHEHWKLFPCECTIDQKLNKESFTIAFFSGQKLMPDSNWWAVESLPAQPLWVSPMSPSSPWMRSLKRKTEKGNRYMNFLLFLLYYSPAPFQNLKLWWTLTLLIISLWYGPRKLHEN